MRVIPYVASKHEGMLISWYKQWDIPTSIVEILPINTGLIIEDIAAVFLYQTNSPVCFAENLITNRNLDKQIKEQAIDVMINAVFSLADQLGYKKVISYINNQKVLDRVVNMNCRISEQTYHVMVRG